METTVVEHLKIGPRIGLLNKYVQKAKRVAVSSIAPVYTSNELTGFNVELEGPPRHMSYLQRLLFSDNNLKVG